MIHLACFDLAGTTVHDDGAVMAAFAAALGATGLDPGTVAHAGAMVYAQKTMGQSKIEVFEAIFHGDSTRARSANEHFEKTYAAEIEAGNVTPIDGAAAAITRLRDSGVKTVFTTGFSPPTRDELLDSLGWTELCDLALSPEDVGRGRPYPDLILGAVLRMRTDSVDAVAVVGDTISDLLAGTRAGASIVAGVLTGAHGAEEFSTVPHTHVLDSVADFPAVVARADGARR